MDEEKFVFEKIYWEEVRDNVQRVNPKLAAIIDQIGPDKNYPLIKARYRFGDLIVKNGIAYLPSQKQALLPATDETLQKTLKNQLSYSPIPLFLTLSGANEVFLNLSNRAIPLNLFYPGSLLGVIETMDFLCGAKSNSEYYVSAGAKNLFSLAKLNDVSGFNRLKIEFDLLTDARPKTLADHWQIFCAIARHPHFNQHWENQVLFFTKPWLVNNKKDTRWHSFRDYIFKVGCLQAKYAIEKGFLSLGWTQFSETISRRNLKPIPYLTDQLKHILLVAAGVWPGVRAADASNQVGPTEGIQQALTEIYALKKHIPTLMHMTNLEKEYHVPKYYSLSYPTILEGAFINANPASTIMTDLREIKYLINAIKPTFHNVNKGLFLDTHFDFFHVEEDKYHEIKKSDALLTIDRHLLDNAKNFSTRNFCTTSQFWRGCVRIANNASVTT